MATLLEDCGKVLKIGTEAMWRQNTSLKFGQVAVQQKGLKSEWTKGKPRFGQQQSVSIGDSYIKLISKRRYADEEMLYDDIFHSFVWRILLFLELEPNLITVWGLEFIPIVSAVFRNLHPGGISPATCDSDAAQMQWIIQQNKPDRHIFLINIFAVALELNINVFSRDRVVLASAGSCF